MHLVRTKAGTLIVPYKPNLLVPVQVLLSLLIPNFFLLVEWPTIIIKLVFFFMRMVRTTSTSPELANFLSTMGASCGNSSCAKSTGAVASPYFQSEFLVHYLSLPL